MPRLSHAAGIPVVLLGLALGAASCGSSGSNSPPDGGDAAVSVETGGMDATSGTDAAGEASPPGDASLEGSTPVDAGTFDAAVDGATADAGPQGCALAAQTRSTVGCEYYAVDPDIISEAKVACFAAFISNPSSKPVTIQVDRAGTALDPSTFSYLTSGDGASITYTPISGAQIPAGQTAVVFLGAAASPPLGACPAGVHVAYAMDPSVSGTGLGEAFHITASAPVSAYDIFPYGGGPAAVTSATLLIPVAAWDTAYIAVDAYAQSTIAASAGAEPSIDIVASQDGTTVTITPTAAIVGGNGVAAAAAGTPQSYALAKGQVLQISQPAELTGSIIQSNKPVGHWGGASCLNVPVGVAACDSAHQQIPPRKALGHEYVAVRYRNRFDGMEESVPWRLVGAADGTTLTYDPAPPTGAPLTLSKGQVVEFDSAGLFSVASQDAMHPFYMATYMTGCQETNPAETDCRGDPEFLNVIPPQQFLPAYTFFTDPTFSETNLVLIRAKNGAAFDDVTLDCAGTLTGWTPIGGAGKFEYTRIDLMRHDFQGQNGCDNGAHQAHSAGAFGLTVWGWGTAETMGCYPTSCAGFYTQAVSYAYPAGASAYPISP